MAAPLLAHQADQAPSDDTTGLSISRHELVERFGEGAGEELFKRMDIDYRKGERVLVVNVREGRKAMSSAVTLGRAKVVKAYRTPKGSAAESEIVLIGLSDLEAVVKASANEFNWAEAFAARADLPAPIGTIAVRSGARGRKLSL